MAWPLSTGSGIQASSPEPVESLPHEHKLGPRPDMDVSFCNCGLVVSGFTMEARIKEAEQQEEAMRRAAIHARALASFPRGWKEPGLETLTRD